MNMLGQKIAASMRQHIDDDVRADLIFVLAALEHGPLRPLHFEAVKRYIQKTHTLTPVIVQSCVLDSDRDTIRRADGTRTLDMFLGYMTAAQDDHDRLALGIQRLHVTNTRMELFDRILPFGMHSSWLAAQFEDATGAALNYQSAEFLFVPAFALLLTRVMEPKIASSPHSSIPIVIPHPEGFFLGCALRVGKGDFLPNSSFVSIYDADPTRRRSGGLRPEWSPTIEIVAQSFLPCKKFSVGQRILHDALLPFFGDEAKKRTLQMCVDCYLIGSLGTYPRLSREETQSVTQIHNELNDLIETPNWSHEIKRSVAKALRRELN